MKQPKSTSALSMARLREQQLVAACGPVWLFNLGIHAGAAVRSICAMLFHGQGGLQTAIEVGHLVLYTAVHYLPSAVIRYRRLDLMQATCIIGHTISSVLLLLIGLSLGPFPDTSHSFLASSSELFLETFITFQYQLSLPIMALLHAFRQGAWLSIVLWRMEGDPYRVLLRWMCNWSLMMLLSSFFELRIRAAHRKACHVVRQQQQEREQQQELQQEMLGPHSCLLESVSADDLLSIANSRPHASSTGASKPGADCTRRRFSIGHTPVEAQATVSGTTTAFPATPGGLRAGASRDDTNASPQLMPSKAVVQLPVAPMAATARNMSTPAGVAVARHARLTPQQQHAALARLQTIKNKQVSSYKRRRHGGSDTVHVKVEGIELEHLPPDLPELLQKQLTYCMPGVTMTGLALRSGCVMMTLDLAEEGTMALSADGMRDLITRLMQSQAMGQVLEDGAPMCIQMPDELALCRWDSTSGSYSSEGAPACELADWYSCRMVSVGPAVHCLSDNATHTSAMSDNVPACHQLTLTVVVELPSNCQLHGWQPAGAPAPTGSGGLLQELPKDVPVVDAMLLARRLDGGYLPVVVEWIQPVGKGSTGSHQPPPPSAQVVVSVAGEGPAALHLELWCKQADAAGRAVGGTDNQLSWVPGHMPGLELLVAHMPLLVLPGSWQEAATELLQHIEEIGGVPPQHAFPLAISSANSPPSTIKYSTLDTNAASQPSITEQLHSGQPMQRMRSPTASDAASSHTPLHSPSPSHVSCESDPACCLLEDLGTLLTNQPTVGNTLAAVPDDVISQLGDDLLVYAVQHGLTSVASLIVVTMQRVEHHGAASTAAPPATVSPSAWLLQVAGCAPNSDSDGLPGGKGWRMSLLHAAMASGSAEMLGHVFRWGTLYGGPDWAWPWELEDATGCTALHLAAAQPAAGACAALLKTITCMLSAAQVQAARNAWLHGEGGMGLTPCKLFYTASVNPGSSLGSMWRIADRPSNMDASHGILSTSLAVSSTGGTPQASSTAVGSTGSGPIQPGRGVAGSSTGGTSSSLAVLASGASKQASKGDKLCSWLCSMAEVWVTRETNEYHAWARHQLSTLIRWFASARLLLAVAAMYRSAMMGNLQYELLHVVLHSVSFIPIIAATSGFNQLGGWQAWMHVSHVMDCLGYYVKTLVPLPYLAAWVTAVSTNADVLYVAAVGPAMDQAPMHQILIARSLVAFFRCQAYYSAGVAHPVRRTLVLHAISLVVSTAARAQQLRAFRRWQAGRAARIKSD